MQISSNKSVLLPPALAVSGDGGNYLYCVWLYSVEHSHVKVYGESTTPAYLLHFWRFTLWRALFLYYILVLQVYSINLYVFCGNSKGWYECRGKVR